jgi:hypothetical protein
MKKRSELIIFLFAALALMLSAPVADAYVGPGPGLTVIGALWAVIAAALLAVLAIVRWPLRYLIRKIRGKGAEGAGEAETPDMAKSAPREPGDEG